MAEPIDLETSGLRCSTRMTAGQSEARVGSDEYNKQYSAKYGRPVNFLFAMFCLLTTAFVSTMQLQPRSRCTASRTMKFIERVLSTAEAEYIALSQAMREVIPLMNIMAEISCVFDEVYMPKPQVKCKVFEDNRSCIAIAESSKFTPRTKHIALKYHHFRSFVKNKALEIFPIDTEEQTADIFTKPLDEKTFLYLRKKLSGW